MDNSELQKRKNNALFFVQQYLDTFMVEMGTSKSETTIVCPKCTKSEMSLVYSDDTSIWIFYCSNCGKLSQFGSKFENRSD